MDEKLSPTVEAKPFKLNYKRIFLIGFAFFGILLLWQVYDSWCPTFLTEQFKKALGITDENEVQYLVGIIMALDNLAALILLPIFGSLSDKTKSPLGKRMPYILIGTFVCAVAFPFIPLFFHYNNIIGMIIMMLIVVVFAMMYRNPAVALMPDMTPKPLRSKANAIINIMGYIGGFFATLVGMIFVLSEYLKIGSDKYHNLWTIELPFIIASALMLISAIVLFCTIKENKIAEEMKDELKRGEEFSEAAEKVEDEGPMSAANKRMLFLILIAEFFWFMADNGIGTFMGNYTIYYLGASTRSNSINIIVGGVGSIIGFVLGGLLASKIGRKWTVTSGLTLSGLSYLVWVILSYTVLKGTAGSGTFPLPIYFIWFVKGLGMSLVHVNSFPMVVELCPSKDIGKFTGYYYASSMAAQTITPVALGALMLIPGNSFSFLPVYASICLAASLAVFLFIKNVKTKKTQIKRGLEALDYEDQL
ncbi:MAG: MFS transporter [Candidatus Enterosoma sp.]|nr:MFS transporter [Candidatus Enterosoma sp.]